MATEQELDGLCERPPSCCLPNPFDFSLVNYPFYTNEELSYFIPCPPGFTCSFDLPGIQVTIPAGTIRYRPTTSSGPNSSPASGGGTTGGNTPGLVQSAINGIGQKLAQYRGYNVLQPRASAGIYYNSPITVDCPESGQLMDPSIPFFDGTGVTIPSGLFSSNTSQAHADAQATDLADFLIANFGDCHWENFEVICDCPLGESGGPFTVPAGTYTSYVSQADADFQAETDCEAQAIANCTSCTDHPISGLSWTVGDAPPDAVGTAAGGSGSGTISTSGFISFDTQIEASCNTYLAHLHVDYTLSAPRNVFLPTVGASINVDFGGNTDSDQVMVDNGGGCATVTGSFDIDLLIDSTGGPYAVQILLSRPTPPGFGCVTTCSFTLTPLTPP